jgi:hypothetical protein
VRRNLHTEINIDAPASAVWETLTDFDSYPDWNPFIRRIRGDLVVGRRLDVVLRQDPNRPPLRIKPEVTVHSPGRAFAWRGTLLHRAVFVGEHRFEVEEVSEEQTRFAQAEEFDGYLLPLAWRLLDTKTRLAFDTMNRALKIEAERRTKK